MRRGRCVYQTETAVISTAVSARRRVVFFKFRLLGSRDIFSDRKVSIWPFSVFDFN